MHAAPTLDRTLADYEEHLDDARRDEIGRGAAALDGARVAHVNSTASGGGVAEMLASLVPLCADAGVGTDWLVMDAPEEFFGVTKAVHNGLQGDRTDLTDAMRETYREVTAGNAARFAERGPYDLVVLHDPQTLGMVPHLADRYPDSSLIWRCHIDLTDAAPAYLGFVREYARQVDRVVFSRPEYGVALADVEQVVIHPAIDPLAEKNCPPADLPPEAATAADLSTYPVDPDRPLLVQVSRFDPWKDPVGVVETYRRVSEAVPGVQLALVGGMPDDDPEGMAVYREVAAEADGDPDVHLLTDLPDAGVNAFQRGADVVLQKSLREGFALTVSEALWKRTPVVGGDVGGIPLQIDDGENGYLVDPEDLDATADRVRRLLDDEELARRFGGRGRETVRERFLLPRLLVDYLDLLADLHRR